jgi:hypothetical protein
MKFTENDLRLWEFSKAHGLPVPKIPVKELMALWKKYGFDSRLVEIMRGEYLVWENQRRYKARRL